MTDPERTSRIRLEQARKDFMSFCRAAQMLISASDQAENDECARVIAEEYAGIGQYTSPDGFYIEAFALNEGARSNLESLDRYAWDPQAQAPVGEEHEITGLELVTARSLVVDPLTRSVWLVEKSGATACRYTNNVIANLRPEAA